ncbi:MAG TPA: hypothetical protein V6C65_04160 [Allocoleopsis sp.]
MTPKYLVTNTADRVPLTHQIFCVDGKPTGWEPELIDECWDHHQLGGAPIQIDEMPSPPDQEEHNPSVSTVLAMFSVGYKPPCIVTTYPDADAIVAATWLQLTAADLERNWHQTFEGMYAQCQEEHGFQKNTTQDLLRAIAFDCDHLLVPPQYSHLSRFAANVVAGLKVEGQKIAKKFGEYLLYVSDAPVQDFTSFKLAQKGEVWQWQGKPFTVEDCFISQKGFYILLGEGNAIGNPFNECGLPDDRSLWSKRQRDLYGDLSFHLRTEMMIAAVQGHRHFPGTLPGEVNEYWEGVRTDADRLLNEPSPMLAADLRLNRVGCIYKSVAFADTTQMGYVDPRAFHLALRQLSGFRQCGWEAYSPVTLTAYNAPDGGIKYTLGSIAAHPHWKNLDFCRDGVFEALTQAEQQRNPNFTSWGGRATVGGSSRTHSSLLSPFEVINITLNCLGGK